MLSDNQRNKEKQKAIDIANQTNVQICKSLDEAGFNAESRREDLMHYLSGLDSKRAAVIAEDFRQKKLRERDEKAIRSAIKGAPAHSGDESLQRIARAEIARVHSNDIQREIEELTKKPRKHHIEAVRNKEMYAKQLADIEEKKALVDRIIEKRTKDIQQRATSSLTQESGSHGLFGLLSKNKVTTTRTHDVTQKAPEYGTESDIPYAIIDEGETIKLRFGPNEMAGQYFMGSEGDYEEQFDKTEKEEKQLRNLYKALHMAERKEIKDKKSLTKVLEKKIKDLERHMGPEGKKWALDNLDKKHKMEAEELNFAIEKLSNMSPEEQQRFANFVQNEENSRFPGAGSGKNFTPDLKIILDNPKIDETSLRHISPEAAREAKERMMVTYKNDRGQEVTTSFREHVRNLSEQFEFWQERENDTKQYKLPNVVSSLAENLSTGDRNETRKKQREYENAIAELNQEEQDRIEERRLEGLIELQNVGENFGFESEEYQNLSNRLEEEKEMAAKVAHKKTLEKIEHLEERTRKELDSLKMEKEKQIEKLEKDYKEKLKEYEGRVDEKEVKAKLLEERKNATNELKIAFDIEMAEKEKSFKEKLKNFELEKNKHDIEIKKALERATKESQEKSIYFQEKKAAEKQKEELEKRLKEIDQQSNFKKSKLKLNKAFDTESHSDLKNKTDFAAQSERGDHADFSDFGAQSEFGDFADNRSEMDVQQADEKSRILLEKERNAQHENYLREELLKQKEAVEKDISERIEKEHQERQKERELKYAKELQEQKESLSKAHQDRVEAEKRNYLIGVQKQRQEYEQKEIEKNNSIKELERQLSEEKTHQETFNAERKRLEAELERLINDRKIFDMVAEDRRRDPDPSAVESLKELRERERRAAESSPDEIKEFEESLNNIGLPVHHEKNKEFFNLHKKHYDENRKLLDKEAIDLWENKLSPELTIKELLSGTDRSTSSERIRNSHKTALLKSLDKQKAEGYQRMETEASKDLRDAEKQKIDSAKTKAENKNLHRRRLMDHGHRIQDIEKDLAVYAEIFEKKLGMHKAMERDEKLMENKKTEDMAAQEANRKLGRLQATQGVEPQPGSNPSFHPQQFAPYQGSHPMQHVGLGVSNFMGDVSSLLGQLGPSMISKG